MTKIKYDYSNILATLDELSLSAEDLESIKTQISNISIDDEDLAPLLEQAKKSINENIDAIIDSISYNIKTAIDLVQEYEDFETSTINESEFINQSFDIKSITIQEGDTLTKIAARNNTTVDAIMEANPDTIKNPDLIIAGENIVIPGASNVPDKRKTNEKTQKEADKKNTTTTSVTTTSSTTYKNNEANGFKVTYNNKTYSLTEEELDFFMAVVAAEAENNSPDDCLAVACTVLNRCESQNWINSHGTDPIDQIKAPGQYDGYLRGDYKKFLNGNYNDNVKNAVLDAVNGVRNCEYTSFRSNGSTSYSDNMIHESGNRYK